MLESKMQSNVLHFPAEHEAPHPDALNLLKVGTSRSLILKPASYILFADPYFQDPGLGLVSSMSYTLVFFICKVGMTTPTFRVYCVF